MCWCRGQQGKEKTDCSGHRQPVEREDKDSASSAEKHANIVDKRTTLSVGLTDDRASGAELDLCSILLY